MERKDLPEPQKDALAKQKFNPIKTIDMRGKTILVSRKTDQSKYHNMKIISYCFAMHIIKKEHYLDIQDSSLDLILERIINQ